MLDTIWLVLLFPLVGALLCGTMSGSLGKTGTGLVACGAVGGGFVVSALRLWDLLAGGQSHQSMLWSWADIPTDQVTAHLATVNVAAVVDPLSVTMLCMVTGVSFLIHWYSTEYMADDPGYGRFFTYLNLFVAAMVLLVMAANFALLLIGWAGVGFASYALIGFWYHKPSAVDAARKAFVINVIGDVGLMVAIFILAYHAGSLDYAQVLQPANFTDTGKLAPVASLVAVCLLIAAYAKSAQLLMHTWLPDAMEGPTPVSALIHAATMVTAGVYLVVRCHVLFHACPQVSDFITLWGGISAFVAATCALTQTDLKRVLAYSTMSQLGYMFMAAGVGAYTAAIYHLLTHSFFKALLFLGAGIVIHATHGEQDMRKMGGLARKMPGTAVLFAVGSVGLAGLFPFAGFWSKEAILSSAEQAPHSFDYAHVAWILGVITAALTAYYISRAFCMTFLGEPREYQALHQPRVAMVTSCSVLAFLTVVAGLGQPGVREFLHLGTIPKGGDVGMEAFTTVLVVLGLGLGWWLHGKAGATDWGSRDNGINNFLRCGWLVDSVYEQTAALVLLVSALVVTYVDRLFTRDVPGLLAQVTDRSGEGLSTTETGFLRHYAIVVLGVITVFLFFYILFFPGGH